MITEATIRGARELLVSQGASTNDIEFASRVWRDGLSKYQSRISSLGIENASVLDAGCGFGQWTLALLSLGNRVTAIDVDPNRIMFIKAVMSSESSLDNDLTLETGSIDDLRYPDASFDWVFCYGSIFLSDWRLSLREFRRVLRPNGYLYVTTNGWNWYRYLWETGHNSNDSYDARASIIRALSSSLHYERTGEYDGKGQLLISDLQIAEAAHELDLEILHFGEEGTFAPESPEKAPAPLLPSDLIGLGAINEYLLRRVPQ